MYTLSLKEFIERINLERESNKYVYKSKNWREQPWGSFGSVTRAESPYRVYRGRSDDSWTHAISINGAYQGFTGVGNAGCCI